VARSRWSSPHGAANCRFDEHKLDGELYKQDSEIVRRGVYNRPVGQRHIGLAGRYGRVGNEYTS